MRSVKTLAVILLCLMTLVGCSSDDDSGSNNQSTDDTGTDTQTTEDSGSDTQTADSGGDTEDTGSDAQSTGLACDQSEITADITSPDFYWSFDSSIEPDLGTATMSASGDMAVEDGAAVFDGQDDYLTADDVPYPEDFAFGFFTSSTTHSDDGQRILLNLGNGPGTWEGVGFNTAAGKMNFFAEGGGGESEEIQATAQDPQPLETWSFVLGIKDGTDLSLYVDGELVGETDAFTFGSINYGTKGLVFGRHSYFESDYFHGRIAEVAFWTSPLAQSDVTTLHDNVANCR